VVSIYSKANIVCY
jgi:hypothetical protein